MYRTFEIKGIKRGALQAAEEIARKIDTDRNVGYRSYGEIKLPKLVFPVGNKLGPKIARIALEMSGRGSKEMPDSRAPFARDISWNDVAEPLVKTLGEQEELEPRLRLICVPPEDVPKTWGDFQISDEARMADAELKSGSRNAPLIALSAKKSRLFALTRNDSGIEQLSERKSRGFGEIPNVAANLPYLAAAILRDSVSKSGTVSENDNLRISPVSSVEGAIGSGQVDVGLVVVDESELPKRSKEWKRGGLKPIKITEGEAIGSRAFKTEVFFGDEPGNLCTPERREEDAKRRARFKGYYSSIALPEADPRGREIKGPPVMGGFVSSGYESRH